MEVGGNMQNTAQRQATGWTATVRLPVAADDTADSPPEAKQERTLASSEHSTRFQRTLASSERRSRSRQWPQFCVT
jgi:hypothetical protein